MNSQFSHPKYRPDIDGLRAVAVLSVVAFHAFPELIRGGFIGVDIFFVISGYLISTIIFDNLDKGTFSFKEFYFRRVRRIFPSLVFMLTVVHVLGWFVLLNDEYKQLGKHIASGTGFISNIVLWYESGYFDNAAETKPLLHLWSLGVEEQFYIIYPILACLAWKRRLNLLTLTIILGGLSFFLNIQGIQSDATATFFLPQTRFWELMFGSVLAWVMLYKSDAYCALSARWDQWLSVMTCRGLKNLEGKTTHTAMSLLGVTLLAYGFSEINKDFSFPGWWALVPVSGAVLIIMAGPQAWFNKNILSRRVLVWFGLISFPLYLWHWIFLSFARIIEGKMPDPSIRVAAVILSVVFAWFTYQLVERPLRSGAYGAVKVSVLTLMMGVLGGLGLCIYYFNPQWFSARETITSANQIGWSAPVGTDQQIELCRNRFPERAEFSSSLRDDNFCFLQKRGEPNVLLIGDSMNLNLFTGLSQFEDINALVLSASAAAPFYDVRSTEVGDHLRRNNYLMTNQAIDYAVNNAHVEVVLLSSVLLPAVTDPNSKFRMWDVNQVEMTDQHRIFREGMSRTLHKLLQAHKRVVFVMPNPKLDFDPKSCLSHLRPFRLTNQHNYCSRSVEGVNAEYEIYKTWVGEVLRDFPQVVVFDPSQFLCDQHNCHGSLNGEMLYRDDVHLTVSGSQVVARPLYEVIKPLLGQSSNQ